jgi:transposase
MAGNVMFSPKQEKATLLLLSGKTILEVSKFVGVNERTLYRWLATPEFQQRLEQEKKKLREQAFDKLKAILNKAVEKLETLIDDKNSLIGLRACQTVLEYNIKIVEQEEIEKRLEILEERNQ